MDNFTTLKTIDYRTITDRNFKTFNNEHITFKIFSLEEEHFREDNSFLNMFCIQAFVQGQCAGYLTLSYLSEDMKNKYFNSCFDYYIWTHGNDYLQTCYAHNKTDGLISSLENAFQNYTDYINNKETYKILETDKKLEFFKIIIDKKYSCTYNNFLSFRHNRPNVEMVCVYNEQDKNYKNFETLPFQSLPRNSQNNFRKQGISQALYEIGGLLVQKNNMNIYCSNLQTSDGKKMWGILENHPKFNVMLDSYLSINSMNRTQLILTERKKLLVI